MELTAIAFLHRERGIKGEVIGESLTSHPERFEKLERVFLTKPGAATIETTVERVWDFRGSPVFKFAGVNTMTDATKLRGYEVSVPDAERVELEPGEYFLSELVGCKVSDPAGVLIGTISGWFENGPQVVVEIQEDGQAGAPMMVPFVKAIFTQVDTVAKQVVAVLPEGLRELNRPSAEKRK